MLQPPVLGAAADVLQEPSIRANGTLPIAAPETRFRALYEEGLAHAGRRDHDAAVACFLRALALDPESAEAHFNLGMALLARGEFRPGWVEYEWRHRLAQSQGSRPPLRIPAWNGMRLPEGRLLLIGDQGYGDTIQFARYVPLAAERCGQVVLGLSNELFPLLSRVKGASAAFARWEQMPAVDAGCMLSSLPGIFGTEADSIPAEMPYIQPDSARVAHWAARLDELGAAQWPRVGVVWSGRTAPPHDARRSLRLAQCAPLLSRRDASFVSLQREVSPEDAAALAATKNLLDLSGEIGDFGETAAVIANLDLVITIDSAVAHLAGALGKRGWVMLQWAADWRWFREREDTPWYPSLKLFRQASPGAWEGVVERVAAELTGLTGAAPATQPSKRPKQAAKAAPKRAPPTPPAAHVVERPTQAPVRTAISAAFAQTLAAADQQRRAGRLAEAETLCREVLKSEPRNPEAYHLLAIIAHQAGNIPATIEMLRGAIAANDRVALYHSNLCEVLRLAGRPAEAVVAGERATILDPTLPQAHCNLGVAYYDVGDYRAAAQSYERALAHDPRFAEAWSNLGNALRAQHRLEEALSAYDRAIALRPDYADAHANKGAALHLIGRLEESKATYRHALTLDPMQGNAHSGLSLMILLDGDLDYGWFEYEWRWRSTEMPPRRIAGSAWEGDRAAGKRLFIHAEQGLGDAIQFVRYLPLLLERGASVTLLVPATLRPLIASSMPLVALWDEAADTLPPFDRHCALLSLPRLFRTTLDNIPAGVPYLSAPADAVERWHDRIGGEPGLKVGIVWAGNPKHINDPARSLNVEALAPLLAVEGVRFFSLQVGPRAGDLARLPASNVTALAPALTDFTQTAGAVANLDLVITADTSVAHLAGAMGKPLWLLTPFVPDWRWLHEREDNPWYPTARLFRQPDRLAWTPVIARVAKELALVVGGERRRLLPAGVP